jgi:hypothetical protein
MKALISMLVLLSIGISVFSQTQPTVTINTAGNRNKQIVVDNKNYTINNATASSVQAVVISDLSAGSHTLELLRRNQNNRNVSTKTNFTLRDGYDLTITVGSDGSVSSSEKRIARSGTGTGSLSAAAYNKLYTQIKSKTSSTARATALENEFAVANRKYTSKQASQLIQLVNSESLRLKLSKQSYAKVRDTQNFSLVTNLLSSQANRTELNTYIASQANTGITDEPENSNAITALDNSKFQVIYNEVKAEPTSSDRTYYLNNFFSRDFNYYTTAQARQLIELTSSEQDRFNLARSAYRGITDKENYSGVYSLLSSSSNRTELASYIKTYHDNTPLSAMTAANFDKLYQSAYSQNSSNARYTSINNAFTAQGNYFTVAQAKKLIPLVSSEANRLQLSKTVYKILVDRSNYPQFNDFLATATSRNELNTYVSNYDRVSTGGTMAMSDADFTTLYNSVTNAWNASAKIGLESEAFRSTSTAFSTYQVQQLLSLISSENDKLGLAKNAYDNIVDPANYSQLYNLFTVAGNKNDLMNFVSSMQNGTGSTVKIAMTETEFNSVYRNIQLSFGIGAKYSSLTGLFNKETNYFTVAQTKQLIQLVSSESNRLELAKSAYNNITDPANFNQLYDIFTSQTSKNELAAYVSSASIN